MYDSSKVYHIGKHGKKYPSIFWTRLPEAPSFPQDLNKTPTPTGRHWKTRCFFWKKNRENGPQVLAQQEQRRETYAPRRAQ